MVGYKRDFVGDGRRATISSQSINTAVKPRESKTRRNEKIIQHQIGTIKLSLGYCRISFKKFTSTRFSIFFLVVEGNSSHSVDTLVLAEVIAPAKRPVAPFVGARVG